MDEGYDTGEKLALKFVCEILLQNLFIPFQESVKLWIIFNMKNDPYDRLGRFSAEPFLLRFYTIILAGEIG